MAKDWKWPWLFKTKVTIGSQQTTVEWWSLTPGIVLPLSEDVPTHHLAFQSLHQVSLVTKFWKEKLLHKTTSTSHTAFCTADKNFTLWTIFWENDVSVIHTMGKLYFKIRPTSKIYTTSHITCLSILTKCKADLFKRSGMTWRLMLNSGKWLMLTFPARLSGERWS